MQNHTSKIGQFFGAPSSALPTMKVDRLVRYAFRMLQFMSLGVVLLRVEVVAAKSSSSTVPTIRNCHGAIHHVHLAVGHDPSTSMTVSFSTAFMVGTNSDETNQNLVAGVLYGTDAWENRNLVAIVDSNDNRNPSSPRQYNVTLSADNKHIYHSPYYHHVTLRNLQPNIVYYYQPLVATSRQALYDQVHNITSHNNQKSGIDSRHQYQRHLRSAVSHSDNDPNMDEEQRQQPQQQPQQWDEDYIYHDQQPLQQYRQTSISSSDSFSSVRQLKKTELAAYNGAARGHSCPPPDKPRWFRTAPPRTTSSTSTTKAIPTQVAETCIAIVGDWGQFKQSQYVLQHLYEYSMSHLDMILLAGDIAYTDENPYKWDTFWDFMEDTPDVLERIPLHVVAGNHDVDKTKYDGGIFQAYEHAFAMPAVQPAQLGTMPVGEKLHMTLPYPLPYDYGNAYYTFPYGNAVQVIMISAYSNMDAGSLQHTWLTKTLQSIDRKATPWVVVVLHVPIYNTFTLHQDDPQVLAARQYLEPLFVEYHVNLVFSGHVHAYMRSHPVRHGEVHPKGPIHITVGSSGRQCSAPFANVTPEDFVAARDETSFGYGRLHIFNATTALWEWIHTGQAREENRVGSKQSGESVPPEADDEYILIQNQYFS